MNIALHDLGRPQGAPQAAFLRGAHWLDWLPQLQIWGFDLGQLRCFLVPQSRENLAAAGLLVVFPSPQPALVWTTAQPLQVLYERLAIPNDAELIPAVTPQELETLLRFPLQFLHPSLGMIGWELEEQVDISQYLHFGALPTQDWSLAHPGNAPAPPLNAVRVPQPSLEEALEALKNQIGPKSLDELGKENDKEGKDSPWSRFMSGLFKGARSMTKGVMETLPEGEGPPGEGYLGLAKIAGWLDSQAQSLDKNRADALEKLLALFEENPELALRYAIPMDNPFASRGTGQATGNLSERPLNFDLSKLGGGTGGNTWNIQAEIYRKLREKYQKSANEAIAAGDYQKAAYIYAHLLHDFYAAANVLQQGKMFREAAVIYKEHVKSIALAAHCLEKGGLYLEAIDLYLELQNWEIAGNLYRIIGKEQQALANYERAVAQLLKHGNYLEAARILGQKIEDPSRVEATYLQGWIDNVQATACAKAYLKMIADWEAPEPTQKLDALYRTHTPAARQTVLLQVLAEVHSQMRQGIARTKATQIGYEVLSAQAIQGDVAMLSLLKNFVPGDKLIEQDLSRYIMHSKQPQQKALVAPSLNKNIQWLDAIVMGAGQDQILAMGYEGKQLWIVRFDWRGNIEYYHWAERMQEGEQPVMAGHPEQTGKVLIWGNAGTVFSDKTFYQNDRFGSEIVVIGARIPTEPGQQTLALMLKADGHAQALSTSGNAVLLRQLRSTGELRSQQELVQDHLALQQFSPSFCVADHTYFLDEFGLHMSDKDAVVQGVLPIQGRATMAYSLRGQAIQIAVCSAAGTALLSGRVGDHATFEVLASWPHPAQHPCFLPGQHLVFAEQSPASTPQILVYDLSAATPSLAMKANLDFEASFVLPTINRGSFAVFGAAGACKIYTLEENWEAYLP